MSLYGDKNVNHEALKRWVNKLSSKGMTSVNIGGRVLQIDEGTLKLLDIQINNLRSLAEKLKPSDDWQVLLYQLSPVFENLFLRKGDNAIHFANYFECFVTPSNIRTYKKIIRGFDFKDIGQVQIYDGRRLIGELGIKSDLIWRVFFQYFINENPDGGIDHTHTSHEEIMSIQLYDTENLSEAEIKQTVNEILLRISTEHGLDFEVVNLDDTYKLRGQNKQYGIQFHRLEYEYIPALYFGTALRSKDVRLAFLSYYQVLEYFFVRAQNYHFLSEYKSVSINPINHNQLRKVLKSYKKSLNEQESLKLVLSTGLDIHKLKEWIQKDTNRMIAFCESTVNPIDLSKQDSKIIEQLGRRIYSIRCAIAHAKGDVDEFIAVPTMSEDEISRDLELLKYIAFNVLKTCSEF